MDALRHEKGGYCWQRTGGSSGWVKWERAGAKSLRPSTCTCVFRLYSEGTGRFAFCEIILPRCGDV